MYCEELFAILKRKRSGCWVMGYFRGMFGYSDDNWALAPSLSALQDILSTCEEYANTHNLKFGTDPDPRKCKTKSMAFLHRPRPLPSMYLCGNPLPWVDKLKHVGNMVSNKVDGCQMDIMQKRAQYIDKNNGINQEMFFAHPQAKIRLNNIYNCHFSGSPIWNLFSPGAKQFEGTYNRSIKIMCGLPLETHRYLIEPLTGGPGFKIQLIKKFLGFINSIKKSSKPVLKHLFNMVKLDVRTTTGSNLRNILLMTDLQSVDDLKPNMVNKLKHNHIMEEDKWRVGIIREIMDMKNGTMVIPADWSEEELDEILNFACVS